MRRIIVWLSPVLGLALTLALSTNASAQTSSTNTQVKSFEVVSVDGNKVVVKGAEGTRELTVPPDFKMTVDGRPVTVAELRPGMKGTATITTTTTTTPVTVTEIRNGEVYKVSGNSIVVRTENGLKMFTEGDAAKRGVKIMRDGAPIAFTELREGDRLTATIVTTQPPKVVTERQVAAALTGAATAAGAAVESAARATGAAASSAASAVTRAPEATVAAARTLPKTATMMPLVGLLGAGSLGLAFALSVGRRRR